MQNLRPKTDYIQGLDGLRALSILMVICFHCNLFSSIIPEQSTLFHFLNSFDMGVDCFFVISGFLITGILVDTCKHKHYYRNFFFRRVLRIFPLYYLILFIAFIILPNFDHPRAAKWAMTDPSWYWLYVSNFYIAMNEKVNHGLVDLSWSLSIEEQFYLVWPWIVLLFKPKNLYKACYLGIAISVASRIYLKSTGASGYGIHFFTFCRLDSLLIGALLALRRRDLPSFPRINISSVKILFSSILILFLIVHFKGGYVGPFIRSVFSHFLSALIFGSLVSITINNNISLSTNKFVVSIGKYSYGIYLTHNAVQSALRQYVFKGAATGTGTLALLGLQIVFIILVLVVSYIVSYIIYNTYEKHFLKLKVYFKY